MGMIRVTIDIIKYDLVLVIQNRQFGYKYASLYVFQLQPKEHKNTILAMSLAQHRKEERFMSRHHRGYEDENNDEMDSMRMLEVESICVAQSELNRLLALQERQAPRDRTTFPVDCLQIIRMMEGNNTCVDCGGFDVVQGQDVEPLFASVSHGTLMCGACARDHVEFDDPKVQ